MNIPYRTRRKLARFGTVALIITMVGAIAWWCWVVWLQRYVVYTDGGAYLDFNRSANEITGITPKPPEVNSDISIYYNEGANAIDVEKELEQLSGYYITNDMINAAGNLDSIILRLERLPVGTPVMIDMKGPAGSFFYQSKISNAVISQKTNITNMITLIDKIQSKGFYTIARVSALRDYNFAVSHVSSCLHSVRAPSYGWMDPEGFYWLDPTSTTVTTWITSVVLELKEMGFDEVLLADFAFPDTDQVVFNGDRPTALVEAAGKLMKSCASEKFTLSFGVTDPTFALPEGRCRMYLDNVNAAQIEATAARVTFEDRDIRLVFLSETGDTRYDGYGVIRSLSVADEVEARKANQGG